jgi:hypothetical protein
VRDGAPDHARPIVVWSITGGKSYVGEKGKSMKGVELAGSARGWNVPTARTQ